MFLTINDIREINSKLTEATKIEYTGYSINFFRRRITYLFEKYGIHKVADFCLLFANKDKLDEIVFELNIPSTELFRDPAFWRALRKNINGRQSLTIWLPNLTNGFELYSLLVLLKQMKIDNIRVVGNVLSELTQKEILALNIPQKYDEVNRSNFERLESGEKFDDYFYTNDNGSVSLMSNLLDNVTFVKQWFMHSAVEKYDLIIFRNQMLEYGMSLQDKVVERLKQSLNANGLLAFGIKETPNLHSTMLKPVEKDESIYRL